MGSVYLCHLTFKLSKFILKNFLFLEIVFDTVVPPNIFHIYIYIYIYICKIAFKSNFLK